MDPRWDIVELKTVFRDVSIERLFDFDKGVFFPSSVSSPPLLGVKEFK